MKEVKKCGSSKQSSSAQNVYDIGDIMVEKPKYITDHEKYVMFKNQFRPDEKYEFKGTLKRSCYRFCKREHLSECFVYSPKKDGVYCIFCSLFLTANTKVSLGSFVNYRYSEWYNIKEKESRHASNSYHQQAVIEACGKSLKILQTQ